VPVRAKKREQIVAIDEHPRPDATAEQLAKLVPAFKEGGTVTAGNSSGINDGAAAVLLAGENGLRKANLRPIARLVAYASAGLEPEQMGLGPVVACEKLRKRINLPLEEIDLVELNEAFAAQVLACIRKLGFAESKVNVNGGAIAMGHPIGASGARIAVTLITR